MIAAALAEDALLDLLDDVVEALRLLAQVVAVLLLHARIVAAIGEVRKHIRHLTDDRAAAHVIEVDHGKHQRAHAHHDERVDQQALFEHRERCDAGARHAKTRAVCKGAKHTKRAIRLALVADDAFFLRLREQLGLLRGHMLPARAIVIQRCAVLGEVGKAHLRVFRQRIQNRHALRVVLRALKQFGSDDAAKGKALGQFLVAVDRERISADAQDHQHEGKRKKGRFESDPGTHRRFSCRSLNL